MAFVKVEIDNYIIGVGQNQATTGGISKTEYDQISTQLNKKPDNPSGRIYKLRADTLEWELVELPPIESEPMTDEERENELAAKAEAYDILTGVSE